MPAVIRSYKIRCYPNGAQVRMLNHWFGCARWVWNYSLQSRKKAYDRRKQTVTGLEIDKRIARLKKLNSFAWLRNPPAACVTQILRDQDKAFVAFFRRVKAGQGHGYPKFRKRGSYDSLRFKDVRVSWRDGILSLPKLGRIKLAENLPALNRPSMATIRREPNGNYYVSFCIEADIAPLPVTGKAIGVDLGLKHLATLSDGTKVESPRKLANRLRYLRQQQRHLARRQLNSMRRERQRLRVAKAHSKVKEQRQYAAHQLTTRLVREFDVICIEDLNVKNMIQHPRLARSIADAGWGEIRRQLEYKCKWYGRTLVTVDQFYPSSKTCSHCQHKLDELRLDVRTWACPKCGTAHDRDTNAAINIAAEGIRLLGPGEPGDLRTEAAVVNAADELRTGHII